MNNKLVSVVVPAYNREQYLENTVKSVHSNTYRPIELIIIDDGSADETYAIANQLKDRLKSDDFEIKLMRQPNQGAPSARNNGLENSTGKYLLFLDSDDEIPPAKLSSQITMLEETGADVCVSDFTINYLQGNTTESVYIDNSRPLRKVAFHKSIGCSTAVMRAELAKSITWCEELPNFQDMDYFLKVLLMSKKMVHLPESLYTYYRYSTGTISSNRSNKKVPYLKRIKSLFFDYNINFNYSSNLRHRVLGVFSLLYLVALWGKYSLLR
jgi:glycosyltransferase involved in cell wall biosynthesis